MTVATCIPFPRFEVLARPLGDEKRVFSMEMATYVEERAYLSTNPKDHIIIMDPIGHKFGLSRSHLLAAKEYTACPTPDSMNLQDVVHGEFIVQIPLHYTIYVPQPQLLSALQSSFVYFGVRETGMGFDHTVSRETLEGGTYVSADHCQTGSHKAIWTLYAIPTVRE